MELNHVIVSAIGKYLPQPVLERLITYSETIYLFRAKNDANMHTMN